MASKIEEFLNKILSSRYGKDVRQAIHDGIHQCYEDGKAGAVDLIARERIDNLVANNNPTEGNSELIDIRVDINGETHESAGDSVRTQIFGVSNFVAIKTTKIPTTLKNGYYNPNNGILANDNNYFTSEHIDISDAIPSSNITLKSSLVSNIGVIFYDRQFNIMEFINGTNADEYGYSVSSNLNELTFKIPDGAYYITGSYRSAYYTDIKDMAVTYQKCQYKIPNEYICTKNIKNKAITPEKLSEKYAKTVRGKNLINIDKSVNGFINNYRGEIFQSETYKTTEYIDINGEATVCVSPRIRKSLQYDANYVPIESTYEGETISETHVISIDENAAYIRISYFSEDESQLQMEKGNNKTEYESYSVMLDQYTNALNDMTLSSLFKIFRSPDSGNVLNQKKWVPFGDSFTEYTNKKFDTGNFSGKYMTYPWLIAERTGINVENDFFKSGRTLAYPSDGTFTNSATCPECPGYYMNIPEDADYITIMLGINDAQHTGAGDTSDGEDGTGVINIGSIDDANTDTYYGAYNTILNWIRTNRPFAHVGIIVSNGIQQNGEYAQAQINIAKKWGYPYINLNGDERCPAMLRCYNENIPNNIKEMLISTQAINNSEQGTKDLHPNYLAHRYESYIIENWIRSI